MARLPFDQGLGMPADQPYWGELPTQYRGVRFQTVYFRAAEDAIRAFLPEPLEPAPGGLCAAFSVDVPFSTSFGPFHESGLVLQARFRGDPVFFCSHVFLDNVAAIVCGREVYGTPKMYAEVSLVQHENQLTCTTTFRGTLIMAISSTRDAPCAEAEVIPLFPMLRLKLIPRVDGPRPAIKQLTGGAAPREVAIHATYRGRGRVVFAPSPTLDLTPLQPRAYVAAFYQELSYSQGYGEVVFDYLAEDAAAGRAPA